MEWKKVTIRYNILYLTQKLMLTTFLNFDNIGIKILNLTPARQYRQKINIWGMVTKLTNRFRVGVIFIFI